MVLFSPSIDIIILQGATIVVPSIDLLSFQYSNPFSKYSISIVFKYK